MKTMTSSLMCIAAAATALAGASAANAAAFVFNSGFGQCSPECPTNTNPLAGGAGQLTDWTVGSNNGGNANNAVQWVGNANAGGWKPYNGAYSIALSGANDGMVTQAIATGINETYDVTFWVSGNPKNIGLVKTVGVGVAGAAAGVQFDSFTDTSTSYKKMVWTEETYQFTSTSYSSVLSIFNDNTMAMHVGSGLYGMGLDAVSISLVRAPEPATWAMMIVGAGLLGGTLRRRNRALAATAA